MKFSIVDENVPMVANEGSLEPSQRKARQADTACIIAAINRLEKIVKTQILLVDGAGAVMAAYRSKLNGKGSPGSGDAFFKHVSDRMYDESKVRIVELDRHDEREYAAFPESPELAAFDRADRKFIALALSVADSSIVNAVDSDYSEFEVALKAAGVKVEELCRSCLRGNAGPRT